MAEKSDSGRKDDATSQAPDKDRKGKQPGTDNSPGQGGFHHADTRMGHEHSKSLGDAERLLTGTEKPSKSADMDETDKAKD